MNVAEKISMAKSKLIMSKKTTFFAAIICNMEISEDNSYPTMATNGTWVKYNHDFVDGMTLDETIFVLCHEVGHIMFSHPFRRHSRNAKKWNMAGDYVINDMLVNDDIGTAPAGVLLNPDLVRAGGGTSDGVYNLLPDSPDGDGGYAGTSIDVCEDASGDPSEQADAEVKVKVMVAQAAQIAKMKGHLTENQARLVEAALKPIVPWEDVLRKFVTARAKVDYTYARPKRRFVAQDLYLPSLGGEAMGEILWLVDCSGSITNEQLSQYGAEGNAVKQDVRPTMMHVVYFDSKVCGYEAFGPDDELVLRPHGGGGTAFSPAFKFALDKGIEPECCVVLTDLYCDDFGPQPDYPVLWVTTDATKAPWGEVVEMKSR
jgi:predicted metal-dependent peptidase